MAEIDKNKAFRDDLQHQLEKIVDVREYLAKAFNNRENSLAITKAQEMEFWLQQEIDHLK